MEVKTLLESYQMHWKKEKLLYFIDILVVRKGPIRIHWQISSLMVKPSCQLYIWANAMLPILNLLQQPVVPV